MAELSASFQTQLKALREAFAADLPAQLHALEQSWSDSTPSERDKLQEAHQRAHRLSGAASTFGFTELGQILHALEQRLQASREKAEPGLHEEFQALLQAAKNLIDKALAFSSMQDADSTLEAVTTCLFVLETDPFTARGFEDQLSSFGYNVKSFHTMGSLLEALELETPSVIIVDAEASPGVPLDLEPLQAFQEKRTRVIPVVFLSDRIDLDSRLQAVRAGGRAYLTKPADTLMLTELLDELVNTQPAAPFDVLIVEDDPKQAANHALVLQRAGFRTTVVNDPMRVMEPLTESSPDLVLMDVYMPGCSGVELAAVIHQQEAFLGIPIVFLSKESPEDFQIDAIRSGGDDFLTKPVEPWQLVSVVSTRAQRGRLLRGRMVRDSVTGLLNHTAIMNELELEVARVRRAPGALSFAKVDLDHFKSLNDAYGHSAGDRVIQSLSRMMQQRLRRTDIIGRYGGEEFAIILPGAEGEAAFAIMDRLRDAFERIRFPFAPEGVHVTLSCGVGTWSSSLDVESLAAAADQALHEAKRRGRNCVVLTA
jgi:diguanylate cyclase (GGDEF)-like protein